METARQGSLGQPQSGPEPGAFTDPPCPTRWWPAPTSGAFSRQATARASAWRERPPPGELARGSPTQDLEADGGRRGHWMPCTLRSARRPAPSPADGGQAGKGRGPRREAVIGAAPGGAVPLAPDPPPQAALPRRPSPGPRARRSRKQTAASHAGCSGRRCRRRLPRHRRRRRCLCACLGAASVIRDSDRARVGRCRQHSSGCGGQPASAVVV